jgi:hypothetical protein
MDGRAQAARQRRGTCPKIVAREVRETPSLASSQLSLKRVLINARRVRFRQNRTLSRIGRMTEFDPLRSISRLKIPQRSRLLPNVRCAMLLSQSTGRHWAVRRREFITLLDGAAASAFLRNTLWQGAR